MLEIIIFWTVSIIYVEAVVEILVSSEVLFSIRNWISKKSKFLGSLIGCGYCMSVWLAGSIAWALPGAFLTGFVSDHVCCLIFDIAIKIFVVHRLSNIWHECLSRWFNRVPWHIVIGNGGGVEDPEVEIPDE